MNNKAFVWHMKNMCKGSIFGPGNTSNLSEKSEQGDVTLGSVTSV